MTARQNGGNPSQPIDGGVLFAGHPPLQPDGSGHSNQQQQPGPDERDISWTFAWSDTSTGHQHKPKPSSTPSRRPIHSPEPGRGICRDQGEPVQGSLWPSSGGLLTRPSDDTTGLEQRDHFTNRVLENAGKGFQQAAIACISRHWAGKEGTAEDFRLTCETNGIEPHHPNAWGSLTKLLKRKGLITETGEWTKAKSKRSHAREIRLYRVKPSTV